MPGSLAYVATKGAISAFTRSLSQELAPLGITVNAVNPGPTDSTSISGPRKRRIKPHNYRQQDQVFLFLGQLRVHEQEPHSAIAGDS